jgi:flagellar FliL protein
MADEKAPKTKSKLILGLLIGLVVAGGGSAGAFFFLGKKSPGKGEHAEKKEHVEPGPVEKLPTFIVNLRDPNPSVSRYLKTTVEVEVAATKDVEKLKKVTPRIRHDALMYLSNFTMADIQAEGGKLTIVKDLLAKVRAALPDAEVRNVYLTEFVIQ